MAIIKPPKQNTPFGAAGMAVGALAGSPQTGAAIGNMVGGMVGGGVEVPEVGGSSMGRKIDAITPTAPKLETPQIDFEPMQGAMQRRLIRTPRELEEELLA